MSVIDYVYHLRDSQRKYTQVHHDRQHVMRKSDDSSNRRSVDVTYHYSLPWFLTQEYRRKHQLSAKDIRHVLSSTPLPLLLQLEMILGHDVSNILTSEHFGDNTFVALSAWIEHSRNQSGSSQSFLSSSAFKDETKVQNKIISHLMDFFSAELPVPAPKDKCTCPYDTHHPLLPVKTNRDFYDLLVHPYPPNQLYHWEQNSMQKAQSGFESENVWMFVGPFNGYQKWRNLKNPHECILIQTIEGHEFLQSFELEHKKRREIFVQTWSNRIFKPNEPKPH